MNYGLLFYLVIASVAVLDSSAESNNSPTQTYLLVNSNVEDSEKIAFYYSEKRGVPLENILRLDITDKETISIDEYVNQIHNPLLKLLLDRKVVDGLIDPSRDEVNRLKMSIVSHSIDYLILTKGIPLKFTRPMDENVLPKSYINSLKKDQSSVDSEISAMLFNRFHPLDGYVPNALFSKSISSQRKSPILRVSRLDAPKLESVFRLIDDSIRAENNGLMGRAYFDLGGPYKEGDEWLKESAKIAQSLNFDTEIEVSKEHFNFSHRLDAPAIYMGWYLSKINEPWKNQRISIPVGSIGYHLYSFSASSLKSRNQAWVPGLIENGFSASFGYVYEPFLSLTVRPNLFLEALGDGYSLAEAYYYANPAISWQSILIGDPLYRPFKKDRDKELHKEVKLPFYNYRYLNQYNEDLKSLGIEKAIFNAKANLKDHFSYALLLKLSEVLISEQRIDESIELLKTVSYEKNVKIEEVVIVSLIADLLNEYGYSKRSLKLYHNLIFHHKLPRKLEIKLLNSALLISKKVNDQKTSEKITTRLNHFDIDG